MRDGDRTDVLRRAHDPDAIARRLAGARRQEHVSDAVLGGIDGCITTFAVVCGALGGGFTPLVALVLGFANLVADGFSMAVSRYESIRAQREVVAATRREELDHIARVPEGEREEVRQIFAAKGFRGETLADIVETICADRTRWVETMITEEHGLAAVQPYPGRAAAATFAAFVLVGALPLVPLLFPGGETARFAASAVIAGATFFAIGMVKSLVLERPVLRAALLTLATGGSAAVLAYLTGILSRWLLGGG
ncbi:VIT1/CCC1 transporter family protein [Arhodomonas sp. KWT2]|uniref:VIT1/CCC1 transporter family protein n=1 Tax=unclassified Arhodomonas TaxID=2621637 RepID=UPI0013D2780D|nr:VIT1/CCC1 transporter family protein [Arhodomonas sp. KWT]